MKGKHPNITAWERPLEEKLKNEREQRAAAQKAHKMGDTHAAISEARIALGLALNIAKAKKQPVLTGLCTGMIYVCDAMSTMARDVEFMQSRATLALQKLAEQPPTDDYMDRRRGR